MKIRGEFIGSMRPEAETEQYLTKMVFQISLVVALTVPMRN